MIKVIFLPRFTGNPYQSELANSLLHENVNVCIEDEVPSVSRNRIRISLPNIIHLHWVSPYLLGSEKVGFLSTTVRCIKFIYKIVKLKINGLSIVWTVHNIHSHECCHYHIELLMRRILARLCDALIVHCSQAKKEVMKTYKISALRIRSITHGNFINSYPNTISQRNARKMLNLNSEIVFLIFGMIRRYKGASKAIDAFLSLYTEEPLALFIVGKPMDKNYVNELQNRCAKHPSIRLEPRYILDDEVQIYMNAADFAICPYEDILTSGMITLAMSFGKIVVAPAIGCIPETVGDSGAILYNPKESSGLLNGMRKAMDLSLKNRSRIQKRSQILAQRSNWAEIARITREVYEECIMNKR